MRWLGLVKRQGFSSTHILGVESKPEAILIHCTDGKKKLIPVLDINNNKVNKVVYQRE